LSGKSYYAATGIGNRRTVWLHDDRNRANVYVVGTSYTHGEWNYFIDFLKIAGDRFTKIHHRPVIKTIKI
jgi:hypothetical protein